MPQKPAEEEKDFSSQEEPELNENRAGEKISMHERSQKAKAEAMVNKDVPLEKLTKIILNCGLHYPAHKLVEYDPKIGRLYVALTGYDPKFDKEGKDKIRIESYCADLEKRMQDSGLKFEKFEAHGDNLMLDTNNLMKNILNNDLLVTNYRVFIGEKLSPAAVARKYGEIFRGNSELVAFGDNPQSEFEYL